MTKEPVRIDGSVQPPRYNVLIRDVRVHHHKHHVGPPLEERDLHQQQYRRSNVVEVPEVRINPFRKFGEFPISFRTIVEVRVFVSEHRTRKTVAERIVPGDVILRKRHAFEVVVRVGPVDARYDSRTVRLILEVRVEAIAEPPSEHLHEEYSKDDHKEQHEYAERADSWHRAEQRRDNNAHVLHARHQPQRTQRAKCSDSAEWADSIKATDIICDQVDDRDAHNEEIKHIP
mmetsp:Transcript_19020/g.31857  ORF Transcript_19020/g.31857 Transcript_19020/m.31857 type:complete len:231 (+) Transcript_19020:2209-2901(+)